MMERKDMKDCRMLVTILLPKGADDKEAFKACPEGTLFAADYFRDELITDARKMRMLGESGGMAIHRAVKGG